MSVVWRSGIFRFSLFHWYQYPRRKGDGVAMVWSMKRLASGVFAYFHSHTYHGLSWRWGYQGEVGRMDLGLGLVCGGIAEERCPFLTITYRYLWSFSLTCTVDGMCMARGMGKSGKH